MNKYPISIEEFNQSYDTLKRIASERGLFSITPQRVAQLKRPVIFKPLSGYSERTVEKLWRSCMFRFDKQEWAKMMLLYNTECRGFVLNHVLSSRGQTLAQELLEKRKLSPLENNRRNAWYRKRKSKILRTDQPREPFEFEFTGPLNTMESDEHVHPVDSVQPVQPVQLVEPVEPVEPPQLDQEIPNNLVVEPEELTVGFNEELNVGENGNYDDDEDEEYFGENEFTGDDQENVSTQRAPLEHFEQILIPNIRQGRRHPREVKVTSRNSTSVPYRDREKRHGSCRGHIYDNFGVLKRHDHGLPCLKSAIKKASTQLRDNVTHCPSLATAFQAINKARIQLAGDQNPTPDESISDRQERTASTTHMTELYHIPLGRSSEWKTKEDASNKVNEVMHGEREQGGYPFVMRRSIKTSRFMEFQFTCGCDDKYKLIKSERRRTVRNLSPLPCEGSMVFRVYPSENLLVVKHGHRHHVVDPR